jgi:hypothetical protein
MKPHALRLQVELEPGDIFRVGVFSDVHYDSSKCHHERFHEDAQFIKSSDGVMIFPGDLFDAIIKSDLKRHTQANDQFHRDDQLNAIVEYVTEGLTPYKDHIWFVGMGNHETAILKHHQFNLIKSLIDNLNRARDPKLSPIQHGGYKGFFQIQFVEKGKKKQKNDVFISGFYFHGRGGSAPVTKGMIDFNRISTTYVADVYLLGHKHQNISDAGGQTIYVDKKGYINKHVKRFMATAGYHSGVNNKNDKNADHSYTLSFEDEMFNSPTSLPGGGVLEFEAIKVNGDFRIGMKMYHLTGSLADLRLGERDTRFDDELVAIDGPICIGKITEKKKR